jgi:hypothetical protein
MFLLSSECPKRQVPLAWNFQDAGSVLAFGGILFSDADEITIELLYGMQKCLCLLDRLEVSTC